MIKNAIYGLLLLSVFMPVTATEQNPMQLVLSRSDHSLVLLYNSTIIKEYHAAFGSGGGLTGKSKRGDSKTPYGTYEILEIKHSDLFHGFIHLDYPSIEDADRGFSEGLISEQQYQAIVTAQIAGEKPPQNTPLGGAIGIHGIGFESKSKIDVHEHYDWTKGCIAIRNHEFDELKSYLKAGIVVTITP